jgi:hypothetical protein
MRLPMRRRFCLELTGAIASGALFLLTLVWHDWIEFVIGSDPDHQSGSLEWGVVAVACALAITLAITARFEWRRMLSVSAAGETRS